MDGGKSWLCSYFPPNTSWSCPNQTDKLTPNLEVLFLDWKKCSKKVSAIRKSQGIWFTIKSHYGCYSILYFSNIAVGLWINGRFDIYTSDDVGFFSSILNYFKCRIINFFTDSCLQIRKKYLSVVFSGTNVIYKQRIIRHGKCKFF